MPNFDNALSKIRVQKRTGNRIQAYCPAHDDKNASLSIMVEEDRLLFYCHAGCSIDQILKATGLTYNDLFTEKPPVNIYQYRKDDGSLAYEKLKYLTAKGKTFKQRRVEGNHIVDNLDNVARIPYNLPKVKDAIKTKSPIVLVEGEKDADTAGLLGYVGTTVGGASDWRDEYKAYFKDAYVILVPDKDDAGMKHATKVKNSLSEVCKSLKTIILPEGKDLTEWVEAGNNDLKKLIPSSNEIVEVKGIPEPNMSLLPTGYSFDWNGLGLKIIIDRIKSDEEAEISIYNAGNDRPDYISGIKLLSVSHKSSLARALKPIRNIDWDRVINQVATKTLVAVREGEPVEMLLSTDDTERPSYLIEPLVVKNYPNVLFGDPGSLKSIIAVCLYQLMSLPWIDNPLGFKVPDESINCLYLDWETDSTTLRWQTSMLQRGHNLGIATMNYRRCYQPLWKDVDQIKLKMNENNTDLIFIDSLGLAVGGDLNATEPAFKFLAALRELNTTSVILAHNAKDREAKTRTIYGNQMYTAQARNIWESRKSQEEESDTADIALFHRKPPPFSNTHRPLGFKVVFDNDNGSLTLRPSDPKNIDEFVEQMGWKERIYQALKSQPLTNKELCEMLGTSSANISSNLSRMEKKNLVSKIDGIWGLIERNL